MAEDQELLISNEDSSAEDEDNGYPNTSESECSSLSDAIGLFDQCEAAVKFKIVLLGKTGAGKSSTANTIMGKDKFKTKWSSESVTKEWQTEIFQCKDNTVLVVDTPGVYDTGECTDILGKEFQAILAASGQLVFLVVISLAPRFTTEEKNTINWLFGQLGENALNKTIIVFTNTDYCQDRTLTEYLAESKDLSELVDKCGGRYHGLNNRDKSSTQGHNLMDFISTMVMEDIKETYSEEDYLEAQKKASIDKGVTALLRTGEGVGVAVAVAGGIVLGVAAEAVAVPAILITGGVLLASGTGIGDVARYIQKKRDQKRDPFNTQTNVFEKESK